MQPDRKSLLLPILLITVGTGWLLSTLGIVPGVDWVWSLGLAVIGVSALVFSGVDKVSIVVGPFFIAGSLLSVLRQTGRLSLDVEIPLLVILCGVLMVLARLPAIPLPRWITPDADPSQGAAKSQRTWPSRPGSGPSQAP